METPAVGDQVRVNIPVDCPEAFNRHGIPSFIQGKTGTIERFDHTTGDHPWFVRYDTGKYQEGRGYFRASELELIDVPSPRPRGVSDAPNR